MGLYAEEEPVAFADETLTVAATAIGPTPATIRPDGAPAARKAVFGPLETGQVRYFIASTPTAAAGHLMDVGKVLEVTGYGDLSRITFIRTGATSGSLPVTYSR